MWSIGQYYVEQVTRREYKLLSSGEKYEKGERKKRKL
jgi:hypothetical protein